MRILAAAHEDWDDSSDKEMYTDRYIERQTFICSTSLTTTHLAKKHSNNYTSRVGKLGNQVFNHFTITITHIKYTKYTRTTNHCKTIAISEKWLNRFLTKFTHFHNAFPFYTGICSLYSTTTVSSSKMWAVCQPAVYPANYISQHVMQSLR